MSTPSHFLLEDSDVEQMPDNEGGTRVQNTRAREDDRIADRGLRIGYGWISPKSAMESAIRNPQSRLLLGRRWDAGRQVVLHDHAALHHELDALHLRDVRERIARHGDDVAELALLEASDAVRPVVVEHAGFSHEGRLE